MTLLRRLLDLAFPTCSTGSGGSDRSDRSKTAPSSPHGMIAASFREWAAGHDLRVQQNAGLRLFGRLAGRDVVIDPGIDGSHPGWVQVTIAVAMPSAKPLLITRVTRTPDFATTRLRALFADADLGPDLRAISIGPHHVRLRLAPGASPRIVEHAVHAVGDTMRVIHAAPESEPRHSCTTTVPYPG